MPGRSRKQCGLCGMDRSPSARLSGDSEPIAQGGNEPKREVHMIVVTAPTGNIGHQVLEKLP